MDDMMDVTIVSMKDSRPYAGKVHPDCPTGTILERLQDAATGPFLAPPRAGEPYTLTLARTGQQLVPSVTMRQAGVLAGDVLEINQQARGAGGQR